MLHIIIIASPSHPLSYWLDHIVQSLTLVDCCFSGVVIAVGPLPLSRQVTGAHCPYLAAADVLHSFPSLLVAHANRLHAPSGGRWVGESGNPRLDSGENRYPAAMKNR